MSDRIAVMSNGVVEQVDTPENVYERPRTTFVAGFIGVSNLMPGTVSSTSGDRGTIRLDSGLEVETLVDGIGSGERCHAVVRPEKLRISGAAEPSTQAEGLPSVEGIVESSVYLGTSTQIVVGLAGDVPMTVLVPNASEAERSRLPGGGAPVRLSWAPEHMHVVRESTASAHTADGAAIEEELPEPSTA
jgi:spermidine/putrescine transport system ATP-binding protein